MADCFIPARILLPKAGTPLNPWASIAVDQFTSEPEYWKKAEAAAAGHPSTLHIVLPEAYLGTPQQAERQKNIAKTMEEYRKELLTETVNGFVYVERTQADGTVRQGLVGAVDLEAYSYEAGAKPAVRPSESTVLSRIPPRLAVRRGATLETPHVMMLADDEENVLIEPIAKQKSVLRPLYEGELMLSGGHLAGWAVEEPALVAQICAAVRALGDSARYARRWPQAAGEPPMVLAVGDGNHSLATAKACWEERKKTLSPEQQQTDPARWCLAEVCNVHSPAIEIEPIHRVLFGATLNSVQKELGNFAAQNGIVLDGESDEGKPEVQTLRLVAGETAKTVQLNHSSYPLTVGAAEAFVQQYLAANPGCHVDYIHGEASACALAKEGAVALLLPELQKADLFRGVVLGGVLPRKTFSMGRAEEKRYYNECRSLVASETGTKGNA